MTKFDRSQFMKEQWQQEDFREKQRRYLDKEMKRRILAALRGNEK